MIKKSVLTLLAVVLLVGAVAVSAHHYDQYKQKQAPAPKTVALSQLQAVENTTSTELTTLQGDNARLLAECQKGVTAYEALTSTVKAKLPAPSCQ